MSHLLDTLTSNALEASVLFVLVAMGVRLFRLSGTYRHLLWLLVLLKLLVPPLALPVEGVNRAGLSSGCAHLLRYLSVVENGGDPQPLLSSQVAPATDRSVPTAPPRQLPIERIDPVDPVETAAFAADILEGEIADGRITIATEASRGHVDANDSVADPSSDVPLIALRGDGRSGATALTGITEEVSALLPALPAPSEPRSAAEWAGTVWGSGFALVVLWHLISIMIFHRRASRAPLASRALHDECRAIAHQLRLRQTPQVRELAACESPMIWSLSTPTVLLPQGMAQMPTTVRRCVLAHELAHLRRRDHWVCWLELLCTCLYWWLPTYWWARRELRDAADEAADGWAVWVVGSRRRYAESLLDAVQFLKVKGSPAPALGHGMGQRKTLARRLTMIMRDPLRRQLSWSARFVFAALALWVLPAAPASLAQDDIATDEVPPDSLPTPADSNATEGLDELADAPAVNAGELALDNLAVDPPVQDSRDSFGAGVTGQLPSGASEPRVAGGTGRNSRSRSSRRRSAAGASELAAPGVPRGASRNSRRSLESRLRSVEQTLAQVLRELRELKTRTGSRAGALRNYEATRPAPSRRPTSKSTGEPLYRDYYPRDRTYGGGSARRTYRLSPEQEAQLKALEEKLDREMKALRQRHERAVRELMRSWSKSPSAGVPAESGYRSRSGAVPSRKSGKRTRSGAPDLSNVPSPLTPPAPPTPPTPPTTPTRPELPQPAGGDDQPQSAQQPLKVEIQAGDLNQLLEIQTAVQKEHPNCGMKTLEILLAPDSAKCSGNLVLSPAVREGLNADVVTLLADQVKLDSLMALELTADNAGNNCLAVISGRRDLEPAMANKIIESIRGGLKKLGIRVQETRIERDKKGIHLHLKFDTTAAKKKPRNSTPRPPAKKPVAGGLLFK